MNALTTALEKMITGMDNDRQSVIQSRKAQMKSFKTMKVVFLKMDGTLRSGEFEIAESTRETETTITLREIESRQFRMIRLDRVISWFPLS